MSLLTMLAGLACTALLSSSQSTLNDTTYFYKKGKLMLGFVDNYPSKISPHQMQNILTFQRTIQQFAKPLLDGELDVGYVMFLTDKEHCLIDMLYVLQQHPNIIAFVGPRTSYYVMSMSSLLSAFRIPTFVYGSSILSDYMLESLAWKYVLPMTATATGQATTTLPRVLKNIGSDIVSVVYDDTDYARPQLPILLKSLKNHGIDIKRSTLLTDKITDQSTLSGVLEDLKEAKLYNRTLVIVTLASYRRIEGTINWLLSELVEEPANTLLITSSSGCVLSINETWSERGVNVIKTCQTYNIEVELQEYFQNTATLWEGEEVVNPLLLEKVEGQGDCHNNTCFRDLLLLYAAAGRPYSSYNHRIMYALRALLLALESSDPDLLREHAARADGLAPFQSNLSDSLVRLFKQKSSLFQSGLQFGQNQTRSVPYLNVGLIFNRNEAVEWREDSSNVKSSEYLQLFLSKHLDKRISCSLSCAPGHYMFKDPLQLAKNCWDCVKCHGNSYSDTGNASKCEQCGEGSWSNSDKTSCSSDTTSLHLINHRYGSIVLAVVLISLIIVIVTFALYLCLWNSIVVVASGRDLATFMFPGMLCGLVDAALLASKPGAEVCVSVQVLSHLFIVLIVPPLFVRTLRILVVFNFSVSNKTLVQYVTKNYVYVHMVAVMLPVLFSLVYGLLEPNYRFTKRVTEEGYYDNIYKVTSSCAPAHFTLVYFLIGYVLTILLIATVMGFKTRKLPENYKESLHIFMCSLITLALVLCYVPAMILIPGEKQVFSLSVIVAILSLMVNTTIFLPKIIMCIKNPELRKRKAKSLRSEQSRVSNTNFESRDYKSAPL
ncbi:G-protein coupled receptor family C group 6 member A-like [Bolinopsis microptera]|uniref:G-protein coupled receptor family C group 6 member A-like n=1 Tax=Bolinopsis microptera TaxID=2820187 RepID=UPI003078A800